MPFNKLFALRGRTKKTVTSLLLPSDSYFVLATLSSPPSIFYLTLSGISDWNYSLSLSFLLSYNGSLVFHYSWVMTRLISWPDDARSSSHLQSHSVFPSCLSCSLFFFSRTGGVLFYLNSSTHSFLQYRLRYSCLLVTFVGSSLTFATTVSAFC